MYNDHDKTNNQIRLGKMNIQRSLQSSISDIPQQQQQLVSIQVPQNRRNEIKEYLKLFGYKSEKTIIQIHIVGLF